MIFLILVAIFAPLIVKLLGSPPNEFHQDLIDPDAAGSPNGDFGGISWDFLLGVEPVNGRDIFSRIVYGARISLLVAFLATLLSVVIGTVMGVIAGYFGGWVDTLISRLMDIFLAFPLLLFAIALVGVDPGHALRAERRLRCASRCWSSSSASSTGPTSDGSSAARRCRCASGSSSTPPAAWAPGGPYILFKELLPNLVAPILVYSTLLIPTNILFEAALSFLGVGVQPPTATWGGMLADAVDCYQVDAALHDLPGHGDLHHGPGLQPVRRRAARRPRPPRRDRRRSQPGAARLPRQKGCNTR